MPTLNRPNAPDRLPSSDFGNLFGRPRLVRGSDYTSPNSTPSPLTTPNTHLAAQRRGLRSSEGANSNPIPSSPLASPVPLVARQRPKQVERRSYYTDTITLSPQETSHVSPSSGEVPRIVEEEAVPLRNRGASESSSLSSRVRVSRITPSAAANEQPPSKARKGFKWKREFSGRWLEIRIGRKERSAEPSAHASGETTPIPLSHHSTLHLPLTQASTTTTLGDRDRSSNAASDQRLLPESRDPPHQHAHLTPREGLYCRTKRALGLKHDPMDPSNHPDDAHERRTATDNLLDRVSSTLRFLPDHHRQHSPSPSSATSVSNLSIAAPRWPRILSRHGKIPPSTSSSIRGLIMGKTPPHTPAISAQPTYTASDSHEYVAVDLTDDGVAFLPSEARRIDTPPLPTDATSPGFGKPRGFFFDYNAPPVAAAKFPERPTTAVQQQQRRDSDWYRVKMNAIEAELVVTREQLALSVPEHLPSSPLCPRHPKHRSGGVGECPYHGRNPSLPDGSSPQASPSERWW